ncbi:MAG TPA: glycosyltransferase N-terminal domain-containing protein [Acidobacteriota bacterium]|jgi:3-deoxy-D-manno-octulosonic-acid transferase
MAALYSVLILIAVWCLLAPWHVIQILRGRLDLKALRQRLGRWDPMPRRTQLRFVVHGVSVGEILSVEPLLAEITKRWPSVELVVTTGTREGAQVAQQLQRRHPEIQVIGYLPWDSRAAMRRWLQHCQPDLVITVETELWPNLFLESSELKIPVCIVNGRIYAEDMKFYKLLKFFFRRVLSCAAWIGVQDETEKTRFIQIGAPAGSIEICGNLKLDYPRLRGAAPSAWRQQFNGAAFVLAAASTHAPEEKLILGTFADLKAILGNVKLILAPRHVNRAPVLENLARRYGFDGVCCSRLSYRQNWEVMILDEVGRLSAFYPHSDVVIVGGTFAHHGGHNFLEAAAHECAIVMGPHTANFEHLVQQFRAGQGLLQLNRMENLTPALVRLFQDDFARRELARNARLLLETMRGGSGLCAQALARILDVQCGQAQELR